MARWLNIINPLRIGLDGDAKWNLLLPVDFFYFSIEIVECVESFEMF